MLRCRSNSAVLLLSTTPAILIFRFEIQIHREQTDNVAVCSVHTKNVQKFRSCNRVTKLLTYLLKPELKNSSNWINKNFSWTPSRKEDVVTFSSVGIPNCRYLVSCFACICTKTARLYFLPSWTLLTAPSTRLGPIIIELHHDYLPRNTFFW